MPMLDDWQWSLAQAFRYTMARLATGVTIVTACGPDGPEGMTANAVCSISLEPPTLLVSLTTGTRTQRAIDAGRAFGVCLLTARQRPLAERFARPGEAFADRLGNASCFWGTTGVPLLTAGLAWLECRMYRRTPVRDHVLYVGDVVDLGLNQDEESPLIFYQRHWGTFV